MLSGLNTQSTFSSEEDARQFADLLVQNSIYCKVSEETSDWGTYWTVRYDSLDLERLLKDTE